jgi:hypothetical protein
VLLEDDSFGERMTEYERMTQKGKAVFFEDDRNGRKAGICNVPTLKCLRIAK